MADLTPGKIDREALERIMQRAAELQAGEADVGEGLTPDEVTALGREVGIPALPPAGDAGAGHRGGRTG